MRIVYICSTSTMYGDNIALLKLIPHLKNLGVDPLFILPNKRRGEFEMALKKLNLPYKSYNVYSFNYWRKGLIGIVKTIIKHILPPQKDYRKMLLDIKSFNPDLIHTNCSACNIGYQISKALQIEHIWHIREYADLDAGFHYFPTKYSFLRKLVAPFNHCICITEDIYNHFGKPITGKVIYDGVFDVIDSSNIPQIRVNCEDYFLFVGRLTSAKGVDVVIKAFFNYCTNTSERIRLKIAGDGDVSYVTKLKKIVNSHPYGYLVDFLGYRIDIYDLMAKAKAFIMASHCEAFGFVTAEAMFCGCPVIGHNVGGTKMQFNNGLAFTGREIGLRYQTEKELEECMTAITHQKRSNLLPMLQDAQATVMHYYTAQKSANTVFQYYQEILKI